MNEPHALSWYESTARQRIDALVDKASFREAVGPTARETSPHLHRFGLPEQFDDGVVVGSATIDGAPVLLAAQEGGFMGGAIGEVHGAKIVGLLRVAAALRRDALLLLDTGGVRLQEANAGETAVAEIMGAVVAARLAGISVVALIGGRAGCFGGGSLIAGCCSTIVMSEQGRLGVTGPEVIETNRGREEFDAADRSLIWQTYGGKTRYLGGGADLLVRDDTRAFRVAALTALAKTAPLNAATLAAEHQHLSRRLADHGGAADAIALWTSIGIADAARLPDLSVDAFVDATTLYREPRDAAR